MGLTYVNVLPNNENKHCRGKACTVDKLSRNLHVFHGSLLFFFFRVGHEQVLHRGCLPHWKQEKTGSEVR